MAFTLPSLMSSLNVPTVLTKAAHGLWCRIGLGRMGAGAALSGNDRHRGGGRRSQCQVTHPGSVQSVPQNMVERQAARAGESERGGAPPEDRRVLKTPLPLKKPRSMCIDAATIIVPATAALAPGAPSPTAKRAPPAASPKPAAIAFSLPGWNPSRSNVAPV